MIHIGIIGGSGYTGGELIRLLLQHSGATIDFVYSTTKAGQAIAATHEDLLGQTSLCFSGKVNPNIDLVFLCLGHGNSTKFLEKNQFSKHTRIIDLSNDFRLKNDASWNTNEFVYGLPEHQKDKIITAKAVANPGCFATAIQLALLPLAAQNILEKEVHVNAVTGSTGAGIQPTGSTHFSWRNNNVSWYKPFTHQHLGEINETLTSYQQQEIAINFLPMRGIFTRGIFVTAYTNFSGSIEEAKNYYSDFYKDSAFTHVSDKEIHLKQVVNTNNCILHLHKHEDKLLVTSIIDNLLKGASGQAIQNMNLMFGFAEKEGLQLKSSYF